ncbi:MAG: DUF4097 and DUF4098 domain-containing protein YvlB [Arenicella sp.]|jgi:DUF4097 and DUF4098 domain-containing protein YvlB
MMEKTVIIIATCLIALGSVTFLYAKPELIERSFDVEQGGTFLIDTDLGSIEVASHNRNMVEVRVEKKGKNPENFEVSFSQQGNDIKVVGDRKGISFWGGSGAHFVVKIPRNFNVDLKTSGGSIELSSLNGKVDAYTSGGSIRLGQIRGDVDVKTSGGSIRVDEVAGTINAHTSGGRISARISQQPIGDSRLTTSGGSVSAYLLPSIAVDLTASTSGGRVTSDFEVNGSFKKTRIVGQINGGGPKLTLKTSGGSVKVKKL